MADEELAAEGNARELHLESFAARRVLYRNAEVGFHESIENKARSENQSCTLPCTHCGLIQC